MGHFRHRCFSGTATTCDIPGYLHHELRMPADPNPKLLGIDFKPLDLVPPAPKSQNL